MVCSTILVSLPLSICKPVVFLISFRARPFHLPSNIVFKSFSPTDHSALILYVSPEATRAKSHLFVLRKWPQNRTRIFTNSTSSSFSLLGRQKSTQKFVWSEVCFVPDQKSFSLSWYTHHSLVNSSSVAFQRCSVALRLYKCDIPHFGAERTQHSRLLYRHPSMSTSSICDCCFQFILKPFCQKGMLLQLVQFYSTDGLLIWCYHFQFSLLVKIYWLLLMECWVSVCMLFTLTFVQLRLDDLHSLLRWWQNGVYPAPYASMGAVWCRQTVEIAALHVIICSKVACACRILCKILE